MNDDDIDPQLIWEVDDALKHGFAEAMVEHCRSNPPHIHLASIENQDLPDVPPRTHPTGVIVVGTVPEMSEEDRAEVAERYSPPVTQPLTDSVDTAKEWKEMVVNDANGPADLTPMMRVTWPTFQTHFDLSEFCEELALGHPTTAMRLIHEAMVRPFGAPIAIELILDTWMYAPSDKNKVEGVSPREAFARRLPGAYECMMVAVATPLGHISRMFPYVYGGGNVEWITLDVAPDHGWMEWGAADPAGISSDGRFIDAMKMMFGPPRVRGRTVRGRITTEEIPDGPTQ